MRVLKLSELHQKLSKSAGPYYGPRGGLWADAAHTIPWKPDYANDKRNLARIEAFARMHKDNMGKPGQPDQRYRVDVLREHGVIVHPEAEGAAPKPPPSKLTPRLFHSAPSSAMAGIAKRGLVPRKGAGTFNHGSYDHHSQGKVFLSDSHYAAQSWHSKVDAMAEYNHGDKRGSDPAVMLRVTKHVPTEVDPVGNQDVDGSRMTSEKITPEHLEFWHPEKKAWAPVTDWHRGLRKYEADDLAPEEEEDAHGVEKSHRFVIDLRKAYGEQRSGHKYKSRKPDGKGGWIYEYEDDVTPKASYAAWHLQSAVRHALATHGNVDVLKKIHAENPVKGAKGTKESLDRAKKDASYVLSKKDIKEAKKRIASAVTDEDAHAIAKDYENHLPTALPNVLRGERPESAYRAEEYDRLHTELHGNGARDTATREPATTDLEAIAKAHGLGKVRINEELPEELRTHLAGLVSNAFDDLAAALGSTKLEHGALAIAVTGAESIYTHGYDYGARYRHPSVGYGVDKRAWDQNWYVGGKKWDMPPTIEIDTHNVDALAHEFGHALDEACNTLRPQGLSYGDGESIRKTQRDVMFAVEDSKMGDRAKAHSNRDYWANQPELFARTFEQYVATKLRKQGKANSLLTRHAYDDKVHGGMFSDQATFERDIEPLMDKFMDAVKSAGVLRKAFGMFDLHKAERAGHKYKSKKPDGHGGWLYEYDEPAQTTGRTGAIAIDHALINQTVDRLLLAAKHDGLISEDEDGNKLVRFDKVGPLDTVYVEHPSLGKVRVRLLVGYSDQDGDGAFHKMNVGGKAVYQIDLTTAGELTRRLSDAARTLRRTLAHEWTHASDAQANKPVTARTAGANKVGNYDEYRNRKVEVTAKIQEISRSLMDRKAIAGLRLYWGKNPDLTGKHVHMALMRFSPEYNEIMSSANYTQKNKNRIHRAAVDTSQRIYEGNVKPIEKSRAMSISDLHKALHGGFAVEPVLTIALRKAGPFIGPKGGKWADAAHTIPWKESDPTHPHVESVKPAVSMSTKGRLVTFTVGDAALHATDNGSFYKIVQVDSPESERGKGIGKQLYRALFTHAATQGKGVISDLTVEEPAARVWESLQREGFAVTRDPAAKTVDVEGDLAWYVDAKGDRPVYRFLPVKKSFAIEHVLTIALRKASPPPGFMMAPNSKHGGYRKMIGGKWVYWYEGDATTKTVKPQWGESHFAAGKFDKDPEHWTWTLTQQRLVGGVAGGVDLHSKKPVKIAGMPHRLWQVAEAEAQPGWARLKDVRTGEKKLIEHERVMPVHWQLAEKRAQREDDEEVTETKEPYDPTTGEDDYGPVTGYAGKRVPPFEASVAPEGTALRSLESGAFQFKAVQRIIADADGKPRKVRQVEPFVPDSVKVKLISEFEPLLRKAAAQAYKQHALKAVTRTGYNGKLENLTMLDLQTSATEGLLRAVQHYPGGMSFAAFAKHYVQGHVRVEAGRMRLGGLKLADREQRLLPGFIAARAAAGRKQGLEAPDAEQVAAHWKLRKRDMHQGLSAEQGAQGVPLGPYKLRGEAVEKPGKAPRSMQTYPGKVELAGRLLGLLEGERAASAQHDETEAELFPGTGGRGLDTESRISTQDEIKQVLKPLESHVLESERTSYRANTADMLTKLLGLSGDDPKSVAELAAETSIERKVGGEWRATPAKGSSQQRALVQRFVDEGLAHLRKEFEGADVEGMISQASEKHAERVVVPAGPTYNEIIRKQASKVTPDQVSVWRKTEGERLRALGDRYTHELSQHEPGTPEHSNAQMLAAQVRDAQAQVKKVGHRAIALRVVLDSRSESDEMRRLQTQTVTVEPQDKPSNYHEVIMTDPAGNQRKVRVRKVGGHSDPWSEPLGTFNKSEGSSLTSGMLAEHMRWPLVTRALYAPSDRLAMLPTQARLHLEGLVGLT